MQTMKLLPVQIPLLLAASLFLPFTMQAELLAGFTPQGFTKGGPSPWEAGSDGGHIELAQGVRLETGLERAPGVRAGGTTDAWGGNGFDSANKDEAEKKQNYFSVTLVPEAGRTISYASIQFTLFRIKESASTYQWQYCIENEPCRDVGEPVTVIEASAKGLPQEPINLANVPALQNVSQPVTFRMLGWGASKPNASWGFGRSQDQPVLEIEGSVQTK